MNQRARYCDECRCDREVVIKERNSTLTVPQRTISDY